MAAKKKKPAAKKAKPVKKAAAKTPAIKRVVAKKAASKPAAAPAAKAVSKKPLPRLENFLSPLDDRVVIQPDQAEEVTAGGLYIPGSAQEGPARGTVLAKGPGHRNKKGKVRPLDVNVGDKVLYSEYSGTKLNFSNATVLIVREEEILGIIL